MYMLYLCTYVTYTYMHKYPHLCEWHLVPFLMSMTSTVHVLKFAIQNTHQTYNHTSIHKHMYIRTYMTHTSIYTYIQIVASTLSYLNEALYSRDWAFIHMINCMYILIHASSLQPSLAEYASQLQFDNIIITSSHLFWPLVGTEQVCSKIRLASFILFVTGLLVKRRLAAGMARNADIQA